MLVRSTNRPSKRASASTPAFAGASLGVIDDEAVALGRLEEAAKALVGDKRLVALRELSLETGDEFGARLGVFPRLLFVTADDVAPPGDRRLLDRKLGLALLGPEGPSAQKCTVAYCTQCDGWT